MLEVLCIHSCGVDLQKGKTYQVVPDNTIDSADFIRVIDDSGENYLYPISYFDFNVILRTN